MQRDPARPILESHHDYSTLLNRRWGIRECHRYLEEFVIEPRFVIIEKVCIGNPLEQSAHLNAERGQREAKDPDKEPKSIGGGPH